MNIIQQPYNLRQPLLYNNNWEEKTTDEKAVPPKTKENATLNLWFLFSATLPSFTTNNKDVKNLATKTRPMDKPFVGSLLFRLIAQYMHPKDTEISLLSSSNYLPFNNSNKGDSKKRKRRKHMKTAYQKKKLREIV